MKDEVRAELLSLHPSSFRPHPLTRRVNRRLASKRVVKHEPCRRRDDEGERVEGPVPEREVEDEREDYLRESDDGDARRRAQRERLRHRQLPGGRGDADGDEKRNGRRVAQCVVVNARAREQKEDESDDGRDAGEVCDDGAPHRTTGMSLADLRW